MHWPKNQIVDLIERKKQSVSAVLVSNNSLQQ